MQPWQNYSMNNYQQYQQPMYQPIQNPYMDRLQQLQAQQMQPAQIPVTNQGLMARLVDNFDSITANDVPMNGGALFIKNDGSMIEYRAWKADGTISKTQYLANTDDFNAQMVKVSSEEEKMKFDAFNEVLEGISEKVDMLSDRIDEVLKPKKGRKEVTDE